jgi:hypothetical protein
MEDVSFVSGPAHVLCLNVASGCNSERCTTEIEKFLKLTESYFVTLYFSYIISSKIFVM